MLGLYAAASVVMAATGALGFLPALAAGRWGFRRLLVGSLMAYCLGTVSRIFYTQPLVVIVGAAIGGLGAGASLSAVRPRLMQITSESNRPAALARRENVGLTATLLAPVVLSLMIIFLAKDAYVVTLIISGVAIAACLLLAPSSISGGAQTTPDDEARGRRKVGAPRLLGASVFLLGSLGGLYTAFVNPFAVVILVERGLSSATASIVISVVAAVRLIYVWLLGRRGLGSEFSRFISHELIIASMTIIAAILVSPWLSALLIPPRDRGSGLGLL